MMNEPQLTIYRPDIPIPDHFYYQAQAFSRIIWHDSDAYDIDWEKDGDLTHVVVANGKSLISYAQVVWRAIEHAGITYRCGGLSGVMTFPFFRRRGYGGQVVRAATAVIQQDPSADIALLWTAHHNESFYTGCGWEPMLHMTTLIGDQNRPEVYNEERIMMRFISEKAIQHRPDFEHGRVYVGPEQW